MDEQFVPHELAKELRILGFNEPCFAMYQKNKKLWYADKKEWLNNYAEFEDPEDLKFHLEHNPKNISLINGKYLWHQCMNFTAPLWQQAFKFILNIIYSNSKITKEFNSKYFLCFLDDGFGMDDKENKTSYEQKETLEKLIELVKENAN